MAKPLDLTGQTLGHLYVIERAESTKESTRRWHGTTMWLCQCECGKLVVKSRYELRTMQHPHCGCKNEYYHQLHVAKSRESYMRSCQQRAEEYPQEIALGIATFSTRNICPRCGGTFEQLTSDWGFVYRGKKYCRWRCLRAQQREDEEKKRGGSK